MKTIRIGAGAGFSDDRIDPAVDLAERGHLDYLVFECLAERSIALAQLERLQDPERGYNEWLDERLRAVLTPAAAAGTKIITNMGAANPRAAGRRTLEIARELGQTRLVVAVVIGDDVLDLVRTGAHDLLERDGTVDDLGAEIVSANAYLGIAGVCDALSQGADVVITGRVADPALFLAPLVHEFGWAVDDWSMLAAGTAVGHLLECAGQVCGGYFADPGMKDLPGLENLGFPIAEVAADGSATITKLPGTGGAVTVATVTEQLLYEVHDPAGYVTPDVVADFSGAVLRQVGDDRVSVAGIRGHPAPETLKASIGYRDSFVGEGQISYAGPNAVARARLALDILRHRISSIGLGECDARYDLIGIDSVHRGRGATGSGIDPPEIRVRLAVRTSDAADARRAGREVTALWLNGPAGGGAASRSVTEDIGIVSTLLPKSDIVVRAELVTAP